MKKIIYTLATVITLFSFIACDGNPVEERDPIGKDDGGGPAPEEVHEMTFEEMYEAGESELSVQSLTITAKNPSNTKIYKKTDNELYLLSIIDVDSLDANGEEVDPPEYELIGDFAGQIINLTKGSVLTLRGVNLSNVNAPAILGKKKIEISVKKSTTNTITVTTDKEITEKLGAIQCEKKVEIGGSGKLTIISSLYHGIKSEDFQLKGSSKNLIITTPKVDGSYVSSKGSGISCENFEVKNGKSFEIKISGFKNGIKADETITIASGIFDLTEVKIPLITDTQDNDPGKTHEITISKEEPTDTLEIKLIDATQEALIHSDTISISEDCIVYQNSAN